MATPSRSNGVDEHSASTHCYSTSCTGKFSFGGLKVMDMDRLPIDNRSTKGRATINDAALARASAMGIGPKCATRRKHRHRRETPQHPPRHRVSQLARQSHRAQIEDRPASGRSSAGCRWSPPPVRVTRRARAAMTEYFLLVLAETFSPRRGAALPLFSGNLSLWWKP